MRTPKTLVLTLVLAGTGVAAPTDIGTAAAVVPDAQGVVDGAARVLSTGSRIHANERITSGPGGRLQLLFTDGTTMNVGSGSDLVLDRYVYDPDRGTGEMAATMSKGVLRFVGGRLSKRSAAEIKTPAGTVGIRGGIAAIAYEPGGELVAVFLYGDAMMVSAGGTTRTVERPGMAVRVGATGAPGQATRVGPKELGRMMGRMRAGGPGGPGQRAGGPPPRGQKRPPPMKGRLSGFGATAAMVAPLPGQHRPGAPPRPGGDRPGIGGPLGQPPPGGKRPGPGSGAPPPLPPGEMLPPDGMSPADPLPPPPP